MRLNLTKKILLDHLISGSLEVGNEIRIRIDQVLLQDHTGTQAFLHFESMGFSRVNCEMAVCYADHNVLQIHPENMEDHLFLQSASRKYGAWFAKPGSGICHQLHLENFAVPGKTLIGADSHTPHCGGVSMLSIGVGGMDAAAVLGGSDLVLEMPKIINIHLTGQLQPFCSAKDVSLELLRLLTVQGGVGKIFEFSGPGIMSLNVQQRATITNMSTELGATTALFPSDQMTLYYLRGLGREKNWHEITADPDAEYDDVIELNLSLIEPLISLPGSPGNVVPIKEAVGTKIHQVMVGSCTNGSYCDLRAVGAILRHHRVHPDVTFFVHPGNRLDLELLSEQGYLKHLLAAGVNVAEPTCGACIGIGHVPAPGVNSLRTINRNFRGRSGQDNDSVYLVSPETAAISSILGVIADPRVASREFGITPPESILPIRTVHANTNLLLPDSLVEAKKHVIRRGPNLCPMPLKGPIEPRFAGEVLLKVGDNISTDDIMPASNHILRYRSNIPRISEFVFCRIAPDFVATANEKGGGWIVAGSNYGQGSSREHAALAPMFLGIKGVFAKSFARIHLRNLINCGILPLLFDKASDYDNIEQSDWLVIDDSKQAIIDGLYISVSNQTKNRQYVMRLKLSRREREIISVGGLLSYSKDR
jgi:aconitate hydratase